MALVRSIERGVPSLSLARACLLFDGQSLSLFSKQREEAIRHYKQFVAEGEGQPSPWEELKNQVYLGDDGFVAERQEKLRRDTDLSEIPLAQRRSLATPLEYYVNRYQDRDKVIFEVYSSGAYSMKQIGKHVGLHYSRISRIIREAKGKT